MHGEQLPDPCLDEALSDEAGVAFPGKPLAELAVSLSPKYSFFELGKTLIFLRSFFFKPDLPPSPPSPPSPPNGPRDWGHFYYR
jgi:hypothetical protein